MHKYIQEKMKPKLYFNTQLGLTMKKKQRQERGKNTKKGIFPDIFLHVSKNISSFAHKFSYYIIINQTF